MLKRIGLAVGAAFEPHDLVRLLTTRRQHQNRDIAVRAPVSDGTTQRQSVEAWNHHVEHQQIEALGLSAPEGLGAVADCVAAVAFEAEMQAHELADVRLVLDDQHMRTGGDRAIGSCHGFVTIGS